jgi:hypothetical protein
VRAAFLLLFLALFTSAFAQENGIVKKRNHYGYKKDGHWIIKPKYDSIRAFSEGYAAVRKKDGWEMVDSRGKTITYFGGHTAITDMHGGLYAVQHKDGTWEIPSRHFSTYGNYKGTYDSIAVIDSFTVGYNTKIENGKPYRNADLWQYPGWHVYKDVDSIIARNRKLLLIYHEQRINPHTRMPAHHAMIVTSSWHKRSPTFFATDSMLLKNVVVTGTDGKTRGVLSTDARLSWSDTITMLSNNFIWLHSGYGAGVMNSSGQLIINVDYENVEIAGSNFILTAGGKDFLADTNGKRLSEDYGDVIYFSDGISLAWSDATDTPFCLLNAQGKATLEKYGYIYPFSNDGYARVISRGFTQYTYVNTNGDRIAAWYDYGVKYRFDQGPATKPGNVVARRLYPMNYVVTNPVTAQLRNRSPEPKEFPGNDSRFDYFYGTDFVNGTAIHSLSRKTPSSSMDAGERYVYYGVINNSGKQLLQPVYDSIGRADTFFVLQRGNLFGIADGHGRIILQPKYGPISYLGEGLFSVQNKSVRPFACALYRVDQSTGVFCTGFIFDRIFYFSNGRARASPVKGEDHEIDRFGKKVE